MTIGGNCSGDLVEEALESDCTLQYPVDAMTREDRRRELRGRRREIHQQVFHKANEILGKRMTLLSSSNLLI